MPNNIYKHNYTYILTHKTNGNRYIGVRSCNCPIDQDNYWSSSKYVHKAGIANFTKEILSDYSTRLLAVEEEIFLHELYDVGVNVGFYNRAKQTTTGFDTTGTKLGSPTPQTTKKRIESMTGLTRSNEFKLNQSIAATTNQHHKNFNKTSREKQGISISGKNNPKNTGMWITPWGKYYTAREAACGRVTPSTLIKWCKNNNLCVTNRTPKTIRESNLGKTFAEIGFSFQPRV